FLYYGTGPAIQAAQRGDADMILVHSPSQELPFLTGGYGVDRKIVAYNFFVIIGPASDPAHINGLTDVSQALKNIYNFGQNSSNVLWFSRNDASGTATKEISLWTAAGFNYTQLTAQTSWFKVTGSGMGPTLLAANYYGSIGGYTISDTGTYLAYYNRGDIQLKIQIQAQQSLLNVYSAIIDDPRNTALSSTNFNASLLFINYLVSDEGQQIIGNYGKIAYGQSLFTPFVPLAGGTVSNDTLLGWIKIYAYINSANQFSDSGTECPAAFRYNAGNLYSPSYDTLASTNLSMSITLLNYYSTGCDEVTLALPSTNTINSVKVNGQITTDKINSDIFQVELSGHKLKMGEKIKIELIYYQDCTPGIPMVLNPGALLSSNNDKETSIVIEGIYKWQNLFVNCALLPNGKGNGVKEVWVNGKKINSEINSEIFEIDLVDIGLKDGEGKLKNGDKVKIEFKCHKGFDPLLINPEAIN
ncbi:MAG: substrate-binding domain-containing protein, partial [Bacteroidia bacterium]